MTNTRNGTMRAAVLTQPHGDLSIEEIPIPEPKSGEVLVKVAGCGVCHTDLHVIKEEVAFPMPCVLGHEISGTVEVVAAGTDAPRPGTRVVGAFIMPCGSCRFCARGRDDLCERFFALNRLKGCLYDGTSRLRRKDGQPIWMYSMAGLAEYAVVPATGVFALPDGLPLVDSAVYGCSVFTAYGAIRNGADLRVGESVAVVATGGVGMNLIQLARAFGASQVIAVDINEEKLQAATELGATHVVNSAECDAVAMVRELTGGRGSMSPLKPWAGLRRSRRLSRWSEMVDGWSPSASRRVARPHRLKSPGSCDGASAWSDRMEQGRGPTCLRCSNWRLLDTSGLSES